jgi:hypothetical protein
MNVGAGHGATQPMSSSAPDFDRNLECGFIEQNPNNVYLYFSFKIQKPK